MLSHCRYLIFVLFVFLPYKTILTAGALDFARSWGNSHITTIDGVQYDFKGHGEYVFLLDNKTSIQVRMEYRTPGNIESTIFTAVAIKDSFGVVEIHLNRTSGGLDVYKAGTLVCDSSYSRPVPCGLQTGHMIQGILAGADYIIVQSHGLGPYARSMTVKDGSDITISLDHIKSNTSHTELHGLAGGTVNGHLISKSGSWYNTNSSPSDFFRFGESWRISENESLFNYSLGGGDYSYYNTFSRPIFYEDYLNNLTSLFNLNGHQHSDADIANFLSLCNVTTTKVKDECLLAIARYDDYTRGQAVVDRYRQEQLMYELKHNTAPTFASSMPTTWDVYLADNTSITLDLTQYTYDNNTGDVLTYSLTTNIPQGDWQLDTTTGIFQWDIKSTLRNLNDTIKIKFVVQDKFNLTSISELVVQFCGCNKSSQCSLSSTGKCNCDDTYTGGRYCEVQIYPCSVTTCFNQTLCDAATMNPDSGPCAACPKGRNNEFWNDRQLCLDIDECDPSYREHDRCDTFCTNTDGSYVCSCHAGFNLAPNGYQCQAIIKPHSQLNDAVRVNCSETTWNIVVDMNRLRRLMADSNPWDIYLGQPACTGYQTWAGYLHFNHSLTECLPNVMFQQQDVVYTNVLVYAERDVFSPFIIRHYNWTIRLQCDVTRTELSSGHLLQGSINSGSVNINATAHHPVNMTFYGDSHFSQQIVGNTLDITVGADVYVKLSSSNPDKMRVHTCYTKPFPHASDHLNYELIHNGCEVDPDTHILSQSALETRFVFKNIVYTSSHDGLYVFCDVLFCSSSDVSLACNQTCNTRFHSGNNTRG